MKNETMKASEVYEEVAYRIHNDLRLPNKNTMLSHFENLNGYNVITENYKYNYDVKPSGSRVVTARKIVETKLTTVTNHAGMIVFSCRHNESQFNNALANAIINDTKNNS